MAGVSIQVKTSIEIFPERINRLLDSPHGPVGRAAKATAEVVLEKAKPLIGTRYSGTTGKVTDNRTGRIKDSGSVVSIGGASWSVVFNHPIAFMHHEGKRTDYPIPKSGDTYLLKNPNDPSRTEGGTFRAIGPVTWKGKTSGNPFLTKAAIAAGLRPSGTLLRGARPAPIFRLRPP